MRYTDDFDPFTAPPVAAYCRFGEVTGKRHVLDTYRARRRGDDPVGSGAIAGNPTTAHHHVGGVHHDPAAHVPSVQHRTRDGQRDRTTRTEFADPGGKTDAAPLRRGVGAGGIAPDGGSRGERDAGAGATGEGAPF